MISENSKIALLAGSGDLPLYITKKLLSKSLNFSVIKLKDNVSQSLENFLDTVNVATTSLSVSDIGSLIKYLKKNDINFLILAGGVSTRPTFKDLKIDRYSFLSLRKFLSVIKTGDDYLLRAFISFVESYGIRVVGAQYFIPELLAPIEEKLTNFQPNKSEKKQIKIGTDFLRAISDFDIGQAAVVVGKRIVALEGPEGTDKMLERVAFLRQNNKIADKNGVLIKISKKNQELRVDLPTIGINTIKKSYEAGLKGIAIESQKSFILNKDELINFANDKHMFVNTIKLDNI